MLLIVSKQVPSLSLFSHMKDPFQFRVIPLSAAVYSSHVLLFREPLRCMQYTLQCTLKSLSHLSINGVLMLAEGPADVRI